MDLLNEKQPRALNTLSCLTDVVLGFIHLQNHTSLKQVKTILPVGVCLPLALRSPHEIDDIY